MSLSLLSALHFSTIMLLFHCEDGSSMFSQITINIYHTEGCHNLQHGTLLISSLSIKFIYSVKMNFFLIIYSKIMETLRN
jgi:hypothetical protein